MLLTHSTLFAQSPCSLPEYRQFDFWLGDWNVYNTNGSKAGDSEISLTLDSCIILEDWISESVSNGKRYKGQSFNTFDPVAKSWQQTWVDNAGSSTEFIHGEFHVDVMRFKTDLQKGGGDTVTQRKLAFFKNEDKSVRQLGEVSVDGGKTWAVEYDLKYVKRDMRAEDAIEAQLRRMEKLYDSGTFDSIALIYTEEAIISGGSASVKGKEEVLKYWMDFKQMGGTWKLTVENPIISTTTALQFGTSEIKDTKGKLHKVKFTLLWRKEAHQWKIALDNYY